MKVRKILVAGTFALGGLLAAAQASAQAFFGASVGQSDIDDEVATQGLITSGTVDGKDSAFKLFGGYMFSRHFGLEAAWIDLGEASYAGSFFGLPVSNGRVEISGFNVAAIGVYPVNEQFSVFAKVGLFMWDAEATDTTGGAPFSTKLDGSDVSFGVGVNYNFTRTLGVRAEFEMFDAAQSDATLLSVGLVWKF